jgi:DNA-binding MarR family transcriptional regulator
MPRPRRAAPSSDVRVDPDRRVGRLIKQAMNSLLRGIDARMQPLELTAMQWEPLLLIAVKSIDTVAALARESQVNCASMTRMLDRLEEKQLLRRRRSTTDRRVVHVELTAKGRAICRKIEPLVNEELHDHLRGFTAADRSALIHLLSRMLANGARPASR